MLSRHLRYDGGLDVSLGGDISTLPEKANEKNMFEFKIP